MNTKGFKQNYQEEDDAVDAMEMAPSDTSFDQSHAYMQHNPSVTQIPPAQQYQQQQQQMVFPPRQVPQPYPQTQRFIQTSGSKERDQSQSLLNLSDSVENYSINANKAPQNNQPSALVRQLSEKVRTQAERLQRLEAYKQLCEKRILELDQKHPMPVLPQHLGQKPFGGAAVAEQPQSLAEVKRQLAIKEQDLLYAKQRNEKLIQEIESMKKQQPTTTVDSNSEALRREMLLNEQLQKQLEIVNSGGLLEKIKQLEDEKNALLDYIEENIEKSAQNSKREVVSKDSNEKIQQLEYEKSKLYQLCENLKYQEQQNKTKIQELEEQLTASKPSNNELTALKQQLTDIQHRYNSKCEEYTSLVKQIDPHFQENTFGNIEDLQQKIADLGTLQRELDFNKEQFESTIGNIRREKDQLLLRIEFLDQRNMELEDKLRRCEKEKDELWSRANDQFHGESQKVDELLYENDNLKRDIDQLQTRLRTIQENSTTLSQTLNETQQELENLVNEHERLSQEYMRVKSSVDSAEKEKERYKSLSNESERELAKLRNEVIDLKKESAKQREEAVQTNQRIQSLTEQLHRSEQEIRDLRHQLSNADMEINQLQNLQQDKIERQARDWEQTIGDLTRELNYVQGELLDKETIFQRVEQELRHKLQCLEELTCEKTDLRRKLDDLQAELRHITTTKVEKEEKLKVQIRKNEELLDQLERLNEAMATMKDEKEATLVIKSEKEREVENNQRFIKKLSKVIERVLKQVNGLKKQTELIASELKLKFQPLSTKSDSKDPEQQLLDVETVLFNLGDILNQILNSARSLQQKSSDLKSELHMTQQKVTTLEEQYQNLGTEEHEIRERMRYLEKECEQLRDKLRQKDEEKREQYQREEKIQRQNQQIKQQLDSCRKEQEKLLMQIKSLMVEKERLIDENKQRVEMADNDMQRVKELEMKVSQLYQQKEQLVNMAERMRDSMPSESLKRIMGEILESVHEYFRIEDDTQACESQLLSMESELRAYAKKDTQGTVLLSTKVINLRKDVDKQRLHLRELHEQKEMLLKRRDSLEAELRCTEKTERRRNDVALETEKTLTEVKYELATLKKELQFANNNRKDLEVALSSNQEEKKLLERELLSLRAQLAMKGNQTMHSTLMNISNQLPPLHSGAALRSTNTDYK